MSSPVYPVRVDASLDDHLSRWLWLVKWLLAIPHYIVLALLWVAFLVLSFVALVAIVFTGRYPRGIFDFNVGVLRWSWRVGYYAYGTLGTDRYPPFSLEERPDYPAHLEIAYPEHLSRGLALVKWWLLAIPHYLVIAIFLGGGWYAASGGTDTDPGMSTGLISLLVFIAAVVLLFTGSYPRTIFDLVLGMNRWVLRVAAYAALMTDQYPPFRLDMGGADPGTGVLTLGAPPAAPAVGPATGPSSTSPIPPPAAPYAGAPYAGEPPATQQSPTQPPPAPPPPTQQQPTQPPPMHWSAGRIIAVIVASVFALTSIGLLAGGLALRIADSAARDSQGYLMSSTQTFDSPGYAISSQNIELRNGSTTVDLPERWLGTVKVEADARTANGVFVGVARTSDVEAYLDGVAHSTVLDPVGNNDDPTMDFVDGGSPAQAPTDETFWVASATGDGEQTVTWDPEEGDWTLVVMNGEGTTPVAADVSIGAKIPILDNIGYGLLIGGTVLLVLSVAVLVAAIRRPRPAATP